MGKGKKKQGNIKSDKPSAGNVTFDLSLLSLSDRVRASLGPEKVAALRRAGQTMPATTEAALPGERTGRREDGEIVPTLRPSQAAPLVPKSPPDRWTVVAVMDRMEEAMEVMGRLPMVTRPKEFGNGMPTVVQEQRFSLLELIKLEETGELGRMIDDRNAVRLPPKPAQITRMEQALRWPFDYLADKPDLARAVSLGALWAVQGADVRKRCKARKMKSEQFQRDKMAGLAVIVAMLVKDKVPVA